jgi:transposase-like protein
MEFWLGLRKAVRTVRARREEVSQDKVADRLGCDPRVLRRWLRQYGIDWKDVPKIP